MEDATTTTDPAGPGTAGTTHRFEAEVTRVLRLVIDSLYSHKEVFLRELLSNASDALDKRRFRAITEPALLPEGTELRVRLVPSPAAGTLEIWDDGVGMTRDELVAHLGTIAKSGTRAFVEQAKQAAKEGGEDGDPLQLIGRFGVGFYSAFLVADRVTVTSRAVGTDEAWRWSSDGVESFTVEPAERDEPGTSVVLHLRADQRGFLEAATLRELVARYSDYLGYPVEHHDPKSGEDETLNRGEALWQKSPSDVSDDEYREFYKHLTHDWEDPLVWKHFKVEGTQLFSGVVFVPRRPPFDLFVPEPKHGVRLHVQRVFVMDDCDALLPRWLRFVRGVVDSDDLPLNVSRETLQDSGVTRTIRRQVTKQVLAALEGLAKDRADDYAAFWRTFGAVLKEGLSFDAEGAPKKQLLPLLRFATSREEGALVSLEEAKARRAEGQEAIYYAVGESRAQLEASPHLEALRKRGWEVLYLTDPVDAWIARELEVDGAELVDALTADLPRAEGADEAGDEARESAVSDLLSRIRVRLQDAVSEVRVSPRLTDSPVCLVVPPGGLQPHLERWLRSARQDVPEQKRILEVNPDHPVVKNLQALLAADADANGARVDDAIALLHDQALVLEGTPLPDPAAFARRLDALLEAVTGAGDG